VYAGSGNIWGNGANSSRTLGVRADGDILGAAIDFANQKVWFRVAPSGNWNGQVIGSQDPANNIGGVSISNFIGKAMGPASSQQSFVVHKTIINAGERAFLGAVPSGFTSGWPLNPPDTTSPTITSGSSATNTENSVLAHALTASEPVSWAIVGGADQSRFDISGSTLRWLSNGVKDFEAPNDANTDNAYVVTVRASDLSGNTTDQTITVTVLAVPAITTPATFNGATSSQVTLTNGNLTATLNTATNNVGTRSASAQTTGKFYIEFKMGQAGNGTMCGLMQQSATYTDMQNGVQGSVTVLKNSGLIVTNNAGSQANPIGALTLNDVVCLAVDLTARKLWARKNGGTWSGVGVAGSANPDTGVNGYTIAPTIDLAPAVSFGGGAQVVGDQYTGSFGATAFAFTVPNGFSRGWPA